MKGIGCKEKAPISGGFEYVPGLFKSLSAMGTRFLWRHGGYPKGTPADALHVVIMVFVDGAVNINVNVPI